MSPKKLRKITQTDWSRALDEPKPGLRGSRLAWARHERGWSQVELAWRADLSVSDVSRFETSVRQPSAPVLAALATALNVSADFLLGLSEDPEPRTKKRAQ